MHEVIRAFDGNKLTRDMLIRMSLTEAAASLYVYMTMLNNAARTIEADLYKQVRNTLFAVRDSDSWNISEVVNQLRVAFTQIDTARTMLSALKPEETLILQTPARHVQKLLFLFEDMSKPMESEPGDLAKFKGHSELLNAAIWKMLRYMGKVTPEDAEKVVDLQGTIDDFFNQLDNEVIE